MKLILFTTLGCHLCEHVEDMLAEVASDVAFQLIKQDIADDDELLTLYATEIPVLLREDINTEMAWPFEKAHLLAFLALPGDV